MKRIKLLEYTGPYSVIYRAVWSWYKARNCEYVSPPKNRKSQSVFICEFCSKKQNSDINVT